MVSPLSRPFTMQLYGYADAHWASNLDYRKSTSRFCIYFGGNPISSGSKKQSIISWSSTKAEYRALALAASELMWLKTLFCELRIPLSQPPVLWCDNLSTVHLSINIVMHSRTKHVEIDIYFVRDLVICGKIRVQHLPSSAQIADILTKPLSAALFQPLTLKLNVRSATVIGLRGAVKNNH